MSSVPDQSARPRRRIGKWQVAILLAVLALLGTAGIAVPRWQSNTINSNESAAIAMLKNISSAQAQMQASGVIDTDRNGAGEYGFFAELSGAKVVRSDSAGGVGAILVSPPVLAAQWSAIRESRVTLGGYVFQMFLPGRDGGWVAENPTGGSAGVAVDSSRAELAWICYAWPVQHGWSGIRCFFIGHNGDVLSFRNHEGRYTGARGPEPGAAAFKPGTAGPAFTPAANEADCVGDTWGVV